MSEYEQTLVMPAHPVTRQITWLDYTPPIYLWVLPDDLTDNPKPRPGAEEGQGAPATCELITAVETLHFTRELSEWLFYGLNPGLPTSAFSYLFNTWIPGEGSKVGEDNYITNKNFAGDDSRYSCDLTFEGNVLKAKHNAPTMLNNKRVWEVESIDYKHLPDPATLAAWQKTHLTIIHPALYTDPLTGEKRQKLNPFPVGSREHPSFVAPLSAAPLFIEDARVKPVDFIPPVYWPV